LVGGDMNVQQWIVDNPDVFIFINDKFWAFVEPDFKETHPAKQIMEVLS
jgi:hypothetical protein